MIGSVIKYFRFNYDYVLWGISFTNLSMLLATIPDTEFDDENKKEKAEVVDGFQDLKDFLKD